MTQTDIKNEKMKEYPILEGMYEDGYFPNFLVDKCKDILIRLSLEIEEKQPANLEALYELTHAATDKFNDLEDEFFENESEIETGARETIAENFEFISEAYGFEADVEELIATREW